MSFEHQIEDMIFCLGCVIIVHVLVGLFLEIELANWHG
jgi:hypothetical protein